MTETIPRPDPFTWNREVARKQNRMDAIKQHKANGGGEMTINYRTHVRSTREKYNAKIAEIKDDPRLPERGRRRMIEETVREFSTKMNEARRDARAAYEAEVDRLDRIANPAPKRGRTADQIAERRELREDLERGWGKSQERVLEDYRQAVRLGDALAMEVIEQYGGEFVSDPALRREFVELTIPQKVARMTPAQRTAAEAYEALKAEESGLMLGMEHQYRLAEGDRRNATSGRTMAAQQATEVRRNDLRAGEEE